MNTAYGITALILTVIGLAGMSYSFLHNRSTPEVQAVEDIRSWQVTGSLMFTLSAALAGVCDRVGWLLYGSKPYLAFQAICGLCALAGLVIFVVSRRRESAIPRTPRLRVQR